MWTNETIQQNSFVKVISGEFQGMVGYVSEVHSEDACYSVIIIDARSFHKPRLQRKQLECAKYTGGCTCVAYIRDASKNIARAAFMGDTRVLLVNGKGSGLEKDFLFEEIMPGSYLSYPHDVFNTAELQRIQSDIDPKDYEIDGPYLINPFTGCEIQPTRGFGDFDMYGSGFINVPDVSLPFSLTKGSLLLIASDGIFDDQVWDFRELVKFIQMKIDPKNYKDLETFSTELHKETVKKGQAGGYVDDISFFCCCADPPKPKKIETTTAAPPAAKTSVAVPATPASPVKAATAQATSVTPPKPPASGLPPASAVSASAATQAKKPTLPPTAATTVAATSASARRSSAMPSPPTITARKTSTAMNGEGRSMSPVSRHARSLTFDSTPQLRKSSLSLSVTKAETRHTRSRSSEDTTPKYLTDLRSQSSKKKSIIAETVRRTHGPSFMLPDGVDSPATIAKLGEETAKIIAQTAVDSLSSPNAKASSNTAVADKRRQSLKDIKGASSHANTVLQRIGKFYRFYLYYFQ